MVERFHGRIVKTVGDGVMVEFGSAVEAMRSAVELQRGMVERNADLPANRRQTFRIGLHLGDVILTDQDVFGDTVNIAARLQALAAPGSIVLSRSVYDQVRDKLSLPFRDLGSRGLKNIDRPLQVYAVDGDAAVRPRTAALDRGRSRRGGPADRRGRRAAARAAATRARPGRRRRRAPAPKAGYRSRSCSSPTRAATRPRIISPTASPRTSPARSAASGRSPCWPMAPCCPIATSSCRRWISGRALNARFLVAAACAAWASGCGSRSSSPMPPTAPSSGPSSTTTSSPISSRSRSASPAGSPARWRPTCSRSPCSRACASRPPTSTPTT